MYKPRCNYFFKARLVIYNKKNLVPEFIEYSKQFENENPIIARESVFNYYLDFIHGLLLNQGLSEKEIENISDREIRKILNPYIDPKTSTKIKIGEKEIDFPDYIGNGIFISLVIEHEPENEITIHSIKNENSEMPFAPNTLYLEMECKYYLDNNYDQKNYLTTINYFDVDEYDEAGIEDAFGTHSILKTPFDWTGYDKIFWWGKESNKNVEQENVTESKNILPLTMEEALAKGEHHFAEFKPGLINWANSNRDMEFENMQAICAFLNAKGEYLFIGVADKRERTIGLSYPNNSRDLFLREFTRIKSRFLPPEIAHTIYGDFYLRDEKEIFIVTIYPSNQPIFLRKKDEATEKVVKEFYVRSDASSKHLYDIEVVLKYCKSHWGNL